MRLQLPVAPVLSQRSAGCRVSAFLCIRVQYAGAMPCWHATQQDRKNEREKKRKVGGATATASAVRKMPRSELHPRCVALISSIKREKCTNS